MVIRMMNNLENGSKMLEPYSRRAGFVKRLSHVTVINIKITFLRLALGASAKEYTDQLYTHCHLLSH